MCLGKWREYTDSYKKGMIHCDLLPTPHPREEEVESQKTVVCPGTKNGRNHAPVTDRHCASPGPGCDYHLRGTQHQNQSPEEHIGPHHGHS